MCLITRLWNETMTKEVNQTTCLQNKVKLIKSNPPSKKKEKKKENGRNVTCHPDEFYPVSEPTSDKDQPDDSYPTGNWSFLFYVFLLRIRSHLLVREILIPSLFL